MSTTLSMPIQRGSVRAYWTCQIAGWSGYGAAQLFATTLYLQIPWPRALGEVFLLYGAGLLLTHWLRGFMRRHRWKTLRMLGLAPRVIGVSIALGAPLGVVNNFMAISALREPGPVMPDVDFAPTTVLLLHVANWALIILGWCALYFVILTARQRRQAELRQSELARALQLAELRVLKSQLNPHFLFNSLNTVRALIADDPPGAQKAVTQLARTLRYTLNSGQEELVTLEQELDMVGDYLALESLRFGERLAIERDIAEAALPVRIPVMLLQTIVENAIKHGLAELPRGGMLRIRARVEQDKLLLEIENPRAPGAPSQPAHGAPASGMAPGPDDPAEGVGLANAAQRLRLLFGPAASLDLDLSESGRALARICIPRAV